ncbi:MAG: hypothetical protein IIU80_05305 [Clostridia bacterium]|nr:hypothetical protein [Clostridia bacterium]
MTTCKKIIAFSLAVLLCFSLSACGNNEEEFKTSYLAIYDDLQVLNTKCDELTSMIYEIWDIVGTDNIMGTLTYMLKISNDFEDYWDNEDDSMGEYYECLLAKEYGWLNNSTYGISFSADAKEFHAMCMDLKTLFSEVKSLNEALPDKVKSLYTEYNEDYGDKYDLINELYLEVSSYAEFSLNPSGSLMSYPTSKREFQGNISKLIKAANIY